jgi:hypothetical protein
MLSKLKVGEVTDEILRYLYNLERPLPELTNGVKPTRLYTHRGPVEQDNELEFNKLNGTVYRFDAIDEGVINKGGLKIRELTPEELERCRMSLFTPALSSLPGSANVPQDFSKISKFRRRLN